MERMPRSVPKAVRTFLAEQAGSDFEAADFAVLRQAALAPEMQRAWEAVSARRQVASPVEFAEAILTASCLARHIDTCLAVESIEKIHSLGWECRRIANDIRTYAKEVVAQDWTEQHGYPLGSALNRTPADSLDFLADYFQFTAVDLEETRTELKAYVGKPYSSDAKRDYVISVFSEEVERIYGEPLDEVVAAACAVILGEDADAADIPGGELEFSGAHQGIRLAD